MRYAELLKHLLKHLLKKTLNGRQLILQKNFTVHRAAVIRTRKYWSSAKLWTRLI